MNGGSKYRNTSGDLLKPGKEFKVSMDFNDHVNPKGSSSTPSDSMKDLGGAKGTPLSPNSSNKKKSTTNY